LVNQRVFDLEDQLASEHVEGLVEVVRVQRGTAAVRRDDDLGHGHVAAGLLAAQQDIGAEVRYPGSFFIVPGSKTGAQALAG